MKRLFFVIGRTKPQSQLFGTRPISDCVPEGHVLRKIRLVVDEALVPVIEVLAGTYSKFGDYGFPPEVLIRAKLLQALFSIKSERSLCEQIEWNAAYRWFVGLDWDDPVFDHSTLSVNRKRLFGDGLVEALLEETVRVADMDTSLKSSRNSPFQSYNSTRHLDGSAGVEMPLLVVL